MSTDLKDTISREHTVPLYLQLKGLIREQIRKGMLKPGTLLTSERKLCEVYNISYITVRQAMGELSKEGFVTRIPGKGTFVSKPRPSFNSDEVIGIAMHTSGHVYGNLSKTLIRNLEAHEYYCIIVDGSGGETSYEKLRSLVDRHVEILIIDGHEHFPFRVLDNYEGKIICINRFESEKQYEGTYVLSDYYKGGKLIAEYFLSAGFEKIIYVNRFTLDVSDIQKYRKEAIKGARDVLKENGFPEENLECFHYLDCDTKVREILSSEPKPMAVWASTDSNAQPVYNAARELKLRIPEDISVIGYYDTPWSRIFHPGLTSVSIREDEIANAATDIIMSKGRNKKIRIEPKLIFRGSTKKL